MNTPNTIIFTSLLLLLAACSDDSSEKTPIRPSGQAPKSVSNRLPTAAAEFVAGLAPNQRRVDAPLIETFSPDAGWRGRALTGISTPIPPSLDFLESQGAWYTPFNQPGMPGYYDLRHWHQRDRKHNHASQ